MCGISLIVNKSDAITNENEISSMSEKIIHRGPDDDGLFINKNVAMSFRRLSVIDLSEAGHQPMISEKGNVIIFNGEIFNYVELKKELTNLGFRFKSKTDTEVILAAYEHWGEDCVLRFNGMWGFVIYDQNQNRLFISRDRFGIKPLYFWQNTKLFSVSSEIKQFYGIESFIPRIEEESAIRFLYKNQLNTNEKTFFKNVFSLEPGHNLIYDLDCNLIHKKKYYDVNDVKIDTKISMTNASEQFYDLFNKAIKIRLRSDVNLGSCLSGGLDSSSIVSIAQEQLNQISLSTISSCFEDKKYDEQIYINEIINSLPVKAIKIFPEVGDLFHKGLLSKIIYHQDQPIKSPSHFSEYSVFESAKNNNLTVMLDGQGADEFMGGYLPFQYYNYDLMKNQKYLTLIRNLYQQKQNHYSIFDLFKNFVSHNLKQIDSFQNYWDRSKRYWLKDNYRDYEFSDEYDIYKKNSYSDLSRDQIKYTSLPYQLHSEDRNSMLHSIESRLPYLDFDLADFMLSLPDNLKLEFGKTKLIQREAFKNTLPRQILDRNSKMGFESPEEILFQKNGNLCREYIEQGIDLSDMIDGIVLREYDAFIEGKGSYDKKFFRIISYKLWHENFIG